MAAFYRAVSYPAAPIAVRMLLAAIWCTVVVLPSHAQESELTARVEHVAGANIYLSAGSEDGLRSGDSLVVAVSRQVIGRLVVIESSSHRSITTFARAPFNLTRGQLISVTIVERPDSPLVAREESEGLGEERKNERDQPQAQRVSVLDETQRPESSRRQPARRTPRVHGRIFVDMNSTKTSTPLRIDASESQSTERSYMSPSSGIRLSATDLPGDASINLNARAIYQSTSGSVSQQIRSARVYQASLSGFAFRRLARYELGRFTSRYENTAGYWDGMVIRFGGRRAGFGVSAGFEPERYNQGLTFDIPKFAGFVNLDVSKGRVRYSGDISAVTRQPRGDLLPHTYLATSQDLNFARMILSADLQVDRDPEVDKWVATRVQLRTTIPVQDFVSIFGRFSIRQPYAYWRPTNLISYRRDQWTLGFNANVDGISMGGSVTDNRSNGESSGRGYGTNLRLSQSQQTPLGISLAANLWTYANSTTRHFSTGLDRSWGKVRSSVSYTYYASELADGLLRSHLVGAAVTVPLLGKMYGSVQLRTQVGGYASRTSLYTRLWMSF